MVGEHCRVVPDPSLPALRRAADRTPFEHPAFFGALGAVLDHIVDEAKRRGERPGMEYGEIEALCRLFLVHFIALGGRL